MYFHQDTPGILLVEGDRLHLGADLAPLFSPVSADCFRPLDEAAFESSRPLYIGSHEDERSVNVPRVESRIGGAEQFGFWYRLVWHKEERVFSGANLRLRSPGRAELRSPAGCRPHKPSAAVLCSSVCPCRKCRFSW